MSEAHVKHHLLLLYPSKGFAAMFIWLRDCDNLGFVWKFHSIVRIYITASKVSNIVAYMKGSDRSPAPIVIIRTGLLEVPMFGQENKRPATAFRPIERHSRSRFQN